MRIDNYLYMHKDSHNTAVIQGKYRITYHLLHKRCMLIGSMLLKKSTSQNIAIVMPNDISYIEAYFGILYADKTVVPISIKDAHSSLSEQLRFCDVNCVLTIASQSNLFFGLSKDIQVIYVDKREEALSTGELLRSRKRRAAILISTSGTSSKSKRVMLSDQNLHVNIIARDKRLPLEKGEIGFICLPLQSSHGNHALLLHYIFKGITMVIMEGVFNSNTLFSLIQQEKVNYFEAAPTMIMRLIKSDIHRGYDYTTLKAIIFGGGYIAKEILWELHQLFPNVQLLQGYGQTEAAPLITINDSCTREWCRKLGSVGKPIDGVAVHLDEKGRIYVKGDNITEGYYKDSEATMSIFHNGMLDTGDIGRFDEDGYLYILGRAKNVLIIGGYNISPEEIEGAISTISEVEDVLVYGKDSETFGEIIAADIKLKPNVQMDEFMVRKMCKEKLGIHKTPHLVKFVDNIKRNSNGKLYR